MTGSLWILIHSLAQASFWRLTKYISNWNKTKETLSPKETGAVDKALMHIINVKYNNCHRSLEFPKQLDTLLLGRVRGAGKLKGNASTAWEVSILFSVLGTF